MNFFHPSKQSTNTLFCFTPLVSLATFIIEISFALYLLFKYRTTRFSRIGIALLVCLGLFQFSEYLICMEPQYTDLWIKIGYIAITLLPALGIHLISIITRRHTTLMSSSYIYAGVLVVAIVLIPQVALVATCQPDFVDITMSTWFGQFHGAYYIAYLLAAVYTLWYSLHKHIGDSSEEKWLLISYAAFIVPTVVLFYLKVISHLVLPSVMCGFAALATIIFIMIVTPRYYRIHAKRTKQKKKRK